MGTIFPHGNINPLNAELNPICYLLALLGAHHFLHVSRIRVNKYTWTSPDGKTRNNIDHILIDRR
jgi:hypothetical protein